MDAMKESGTGAGAETWIVRLHAGDRSVLEEVYREHFAAVDRAVRAVLSCVADRETVVQEVFYRMVTMPTVREGFTGGSMVAWICTVARNLAIDHARRHGRELSVAPEDVASLADARRRGNGLDPEAHLLVERFRQSLPEAWLAVFDARFLGEMTQREAAAALGIRRTTLEYRELRIKARLRHFLREDKRP
jgi:RNA polymerase sigma-70 factor, ECF subfamily